MGHRTSYAFGHRKHEERLAEQGRFLAERFADRVGDIADLEAATERIIELADEDEGIAFNSADFGNDDHTICFEAAYTWLATLRGVPTDA